jgi:hypothetical protein
MSTILTTPTVASPPPTTPPPNLGGIPEELRDTPRWVTWRYEPRERDGAVTWTKVPYNANSPAASPTRASATDPTTWATVVTAVIAYLTGQNLGLCDGIGLVLNGTDFTAIDLDHVVDEQGRPHDEAARIIHEVNSYTEISPSGTGLRIIARGALPAGGWRKTSKFPIPIEMYDTERYVTMTGRHLARTPMTVEARPAELAALHARVATAIDTEFAEGGGGKRTEVGSPRTKSPKMDDDTIVALARRDERRGKRFDQLMRGDLTDYHGDHSAADLALCSLLAYYTQDPQQIDRIFRLSKLDRLKWERVDYRERTITKAVDGREHVYSGAQADAELSDDELGDGWEVDARPTISLGEEEVAGVKNRILARLALRNHPDRGTPKVFQRSGLLAGMAFPLGEGPKIFTYDSGTMTAYLQREYVWQRVTARGIVYVEPPSGYVNDVLSQKIYRGIPPLIDVVETPVFAPDGGVTTTSGYHPTSGIWYNPAPTFEVAPVPECPTADDVAKARSLFLDHLYVDFPFADEASRAHALAAVLLPFVRSFIDGPTPLHAFDAPAIGSGKTLLANLAAIIATGRDAAPMAHAGDEEEYRKMILARLLEGGGPILIDNVQDSRKVDSGALAAALTGTEYSGRILGVSKMGRAPNRALWMMTGNNLELSREIARRTIVSKLLPEQERPHERREADFKHPLPRWAKEHRAELVHAALTLVRSWWVTGRPPGDTTLATFEAWSHVVGGILKVADIGGFLSNQREYFDAQDHALDPWRAFYAEWLETDGGKSRTTADLISLAAAHLTSELSDTKSQFEHLPSNARTHRLSRALRKMLNRPIGDGDQARRLQQVNGRTAGLVRWELEPVRPRRSTM